VDVDYQAGPEKAVLVGLEFSSQHWTVPETKGSDMVVEGLIIKTPN
jgi:hypothetical protein